MFKFLADRKDKAFLASAFEEAAAKSSWIAITCLERNVEFFESHPEWMDKARAAIEGAMQSAERRNYRFSFNFCMHFINEILDYHPHLIEQDTQLADATTEVIGLSKRITPVFQRLYGN